MIALWYHAFGLTSIVPDEAVVTDGITSWNPGRPVPHRVPSKKEVLALDQNRILRNIMRNEAIMPPIETETRKIIARLRRDGWINAGGAKHDKFEHPDRPGVLMVVPRHKLQSPGVARSIAKLAGWI